MVDAVLSYHMNPLTCGVAKFSQQLAARLGVPFDSVAHGADYTHPLLSLKWSEMRLGRTFDLPRTYDVLWHDAGDPHMTSLATHAWFATDTGCPATVRGDATRGTLNVLTYGMAHKCHVPGFERLKAALDRTGRDYTLSVSTAIHDGYSWATIFAENQILMRRMFGDHLRVLGFLADDALAKELREVQAVALFFDPAARANNTSLWAALEAGTPVITNLDHDSPQELQHGVSVFDLAHLTDWPDAAACRVVRAGGRKAADAYSWDRLIATLTAPVTV